MKDSDKINETPLDKHRKLIYGKLVYKNLSDIDYCELSKDVYGKAYSSDVARRMMYGSKYTLDLLESEMINMKSKSDEEFSKLTIETKAEKQKLSDLRNDVNALIRKRARQEEINEIITSAIQNSNMKEFEYTPVDAKQSDNDLIVTLNDIHFGANVNNPWRVYNSSICEEMMMEYLDKVIDIASFHNSENCYVVCAGDAISGNIHYPIAVTNKENVIEQVVGVSELISRFLFLLSFKFAKVTYISVAGNHSRLNPNKDNSLYTERMEDLISWYLKARLQNIKNVSISTEYNLGNTMAVFNIRGKNFCCVHGDYDGSDSKINSLKEMSNVELYAVISGHLHHNSTNNVNGVRTIMAGSFLGMDDYCIQKRIIGKPEQIVCVCTDKGILCHYDIEL